MKALRDLTFLCALLLGMLWFTTDPSTAVATIPSEQLVPEQVAKPLSADALLPLSTRLQTSAQPNLPAFKNVGNQLAVSRAWTVADAFAPLNAFSQAVARSCASQQKRRLLFPFHEFS